MAQQNKRITALYNGGETELKSGVLLNVRDTIEMLLEDANKALKTDGLTNIFTLEGSRIVDIATVRDGDKLVFTKGEDFVSVSAKKQLLHSLATQMCSIYDSSAGYVKTHSPTFVSTGLTNAEEIVKKVAGTEMGKKVIDLHWMLMNVADDKLDATILRFQNVFASFSKTDVAKTVNENLVLPAKHRVEAFYAYAFETYIALDMDHDGKVSIADFQHSLQQKLGSAYNQNLVEPTKKFYQVAQQEMANLAKKADESKAEVSKIYIRMKYNLGAGWRDSVAQNFVKTRVQAPAEAFYRAAVDSYMTLDMDHDGKVSLSDFIAGIKVNLGAWNAKLAGPAQHLYNLFKSSATQSDKSAAASPK